jgi:hypothetical protein
MLGTTPTAAVPSPTEARVKVVFVNDSTSNANWGDRAAAISLMAMVERVGGEIVHVVTEQDLKDTTFRGRGVHPSPAEADLKRGRLRSFVPPILLEIRRRRMRPVATSRGGLIPRTWAEFESSAAAVLGPRDPWPELLDAIRGCDVVAIHGDGGMVGNGVLPRTVLFLTYLAKQHLHKPVIMVNHTADFDHADLRASAERVYPTFDDVVFRDAVSVERCAAFCAGRFAPDSAFTFRPLDRDAWLPVAGRATFFDVWPETALFDPARPYVCVGGSSILGGDRDAGAIAGQFALLVRHLQSVYAGQIVLTVSDIVDEPVMRPLAEGLGLPLIAVRTSVQQAVDIVGNADAYIGGRWHPSIFALRGGAPIIALSSKTFKMRALAEAAGLSSSVFDALEVGREAEAIGRGLLGLLEQGDELRKRLRTWGDAQAEAAWGNVRYLKDWRG